MPTLGIHCSDMIYEFSLNPLSMETSKQLDYLIHITMLYGMICSYKIEYTTVLVEHGHVIQNYNPIFGILIECAQMNAIGIYNKLVNHVFY